MKKLVGIMPIKMNNERLPGKNTRLLGDKPLLQYALTSLRDTGLVEDIYVYCSNDNIQKYLPDRISFLKREEYLDLPTSNFTQIFESFMSCVDAYIYVYTHATAPFIKKETIASCINNVKNGPFDSAFCATKIQDFLWQDNKPLNFNAEDLPRSQDLKPIYRETSGVYVFTREVFKKLKRRIGINPYIHVVTYKEAVDINEDADFRLAEAMLNIDL